MKHLLYILLLFFALPVFGQEQKGVTYLSSKDIPVSLEKNWKFHSGDDTAWAAVDYNDSSWEHLNPALRLSDSADEKFNTIGWFRLHIHADKSMEDAVIAAQIHHYGASEIYLDGKKIKTYGKIGTTEDSSEAFNPNNKPLPLKTLDSGMHVFAVRYCSYHTKEMWEADSYVVTGFTLKLYNADDYILDYITDMTAWGLILLIMCGFFLALCISHFLLWLYYKSTYSNLYFSIFCLGVSILFIVPYLSQIIHEPQWMQTSTYIIIVTTVALTISLSGVSNELFSANKKRFRIIALISLLPLIMLPYKTEISAIVLICTLMIVAAESIVLTAYAIYKKKPGARIVGGGILFSTLFVFSILSISFLNNGLNVNGGILSAVLLLLTAAAILSIPLSMSTYLAWHFANVARNLKTQLQQVQVLNEKTIHQEQEKQHLLETEKERLEDEVQIRTKEIVEEKQKSDDLLRNILPEEVANELKQKGTSAARYFDHVSVIFTDFVDFTKAGERFTPQQLVDELHTCFRAFDDIISKYHIEKIKTIGDAYLAVSGLPAADADHAVKTVKAAIEIKRFMNERKQRLGDQTFDIRIGIHSGAVVAGIVGVKKFAYDIWGDTVNTAARMEQSGVANTINISQTTYDLVKHHFNCTYRGEIAAKNKGDMNMYFVEGEKTEG